MTKLLEIREILKRIYVKNELAIKPLAKFFLALIVFNTINSHLGYMALIDNAMIAVALAALCSFLPMGTTLFFAACISLAHMYSLSLETLVLGLCVYLVVFILFLRFNTKESLILLITPLLFVWRMPFVVPVAVGLIGGPASAVAVSCGVIVYYFMNTVTECATTLSTMGSDEILNRVRFLIDSFVSDKTMFVMAVAFAITVLIVYLLRRMSIDHSWTIAMIAGAVLDMIILLLGDLIFDTNISLAAIFLGAVLAIAVGKILEFFNFCVDYRRTEKVQFEDDEYYYYVKAVPKMTVPEVSKSVKKINRQMTSDRQVVTERTAPMSSRERGFDRNEINRGRSVSVNSSAMDYNEEENEEDFF